MYLIPTGETLLTGGYAFRLEGTGIAPGDAAMIINTETRTLADILSETGYKTSVVGKWHLGLGGEGGPDWNCFITPGPQDTSYLGNRRLTATISYNRETQQWH